MQVVRVLGPAEVGLADGGRFGGLSLKHRTLLAALALYRADGVRADALVELLWPGQVPRTAAGTLQGYVSALRRVLEPGRQPRGPSRVLVTGDASYRLVVPAGGVDVAEFESEVAAVHRFLTIGRLPDAVSSVPDRLSGPEVMALEGRLTRVLGLWRGTPFVELGDAGDAVAERARLEELRLVAVEDRALLRLARGEQAIVVGDLEPLARAYPFRESLQAVHILALAAAGRQGDALTALRRVRERLAEDLGADPGPGLRRLELAVLRQESLSTGRVRSAPDVRVAPSTLEDLPLIGRDEQLNRLTGLLDAAAQGRPQFAVVVGEAGIGKTRLVEALAQVAAARGFVVAVGRCLDDDGAPPMWPWTQLLSEVRRRFADDPDSPRQSPSAASPPVASAGSAMSAADARVAQFLARDAVAGELRAWAVRGPVLVVVEDAHWADPSSAQLLRHVADTLRDGCLVVVATSRGRSAGGEAVGAASEALARRSALRIDLAGLGELETAALVAAATGRALSVGDVRLLRRRTGGNPFFVLEVARAGEGTSVPAAVGDITARRLAALPAASQHLLRVAAVIGEGFDLRLLSAAAGVAQDQTLAELEPAIETQLVRPEPDPDVFAFSHALVRDAVYQSVAPSRRARMHAAVAAVLEEDGPQRPLEAVRTRTAWHWLGAGPEWVHRAWPAAIAAAADAIGLHAYQEAADLLRAAADAAQRDPECSGEQRFDVLLSGLRASTVSGDRMRVQQAAARAVDQAWQLSDPLRAATAAVASADGAIWSLRPYGVVDEEMVGTLRRAVRELPASDERMRCQVLLVLAAELYYADASRERRALFDEGLAMARRLADPALLAWACLTAPNAIWAPGTARTRHDLADEAVAAARRAGSQTMLADALVRRAGAALELGRVSEIDDDLAEARRIADRLQLAYPLIAMNMMLIPWRAMQGRFLEAQHLCGQVLHLASTVRLQPGDAVAVGASLPLLMWQGRTQEALEALPDPNPAATDSSLEVGRRLLLGQLGRLDDLRVSWQRTGTPDPPDDWFTVFRWCEAAVTALALGLPQVAAAVYRRLAPFAGTVASAGASGPLGPVDTYLAVAAAAAGEPQNAARHADDAIALCERWAIPVCGQAVQALRAAAGF